MFNFLLDFEFFGDFLGPLQIVEDLMMLLFDLFEFALFIDDFFNLPKVDVIVSFPLFGGQLTVAA